MQGEIPYHYTPEEQREFIDEYARRIPELSAYMYRRLPEWGFIVRPPEWAVGDILVWYDPSNVLHVIDVTNLPIVDGIVQAVYRPPMFAAGIELAKAVAKTARDAIAGIPSLEETESLLRLGVFVLVAGVAWQVLK